MMKQKFMKLGVLSIFLIVNILIISPSLSLADVTFTAGKGSAIPGSTDNPVTVSLENQNDQVKGIMVDVCDVDNYLTCTACEKTTRTSSFWCTAFMQDGCCKVLLISLSGDLIEVGEGPIFTLKYDVSSGAPSQECRVLNLENVSVSDINLQPLDVILETGGFCFPCTVNADCDDGLSCNGEETCVGGICQSGTDLCGPSLLCDERNDECISACLEDTDCNDGDFCNGEETCLGEYCQPGTNPCLSGTPCDEVDDVCNCSLDVQCDDGLYCNGTETCLDGICQAGSDPCQTGALCNEVDDVCNCSLAEQCDDGLYCNGAETCAGGVCQAASDPPCAPLLCDEDIDECVDCLIDNDCDDGLSCNGVETCLDGICQAGSDLCPDDGIFCNGTESCNEETDSCELSSDPCAPLLCDEVSEECYCEADEQCDDGLYCNGAETCMDGVCQAGSDPCSGQSCNEDDDTCEPIIPTTSTTITTTPPPPPPPQTTTTVPSTATTTTTALTTTTVPPPPTTTTTTTIPSSYEVSISPSDATLSYGETVQFSAKTIYEGEEVEGTYSWEIVPGSTVGSTINDGLFTAGENTSDADIRETIRVTDLNHEDKSATATVTIKRESDGTERIVTAFPDTLLGSRWMLLPYLLLIVGEDINFDPGSTISFEPEEDILKLGQVGLGDIFLTLFFLNANPQEGTVNFTIDTGEEDVTGELTIKLLPQPFVENN